MQTARRKERTTRLEKEALDAQAAQLAEYKAQQAAIVKTLNKEARRKVADENTRVKELTATVKEVNDQRLANRVEAVLELKTNVDAVRAEVATLADKHVRKVERAKKQLADEKESLLAQGLNPYVEFRKKEIEEEAAAREKRMKTAVERNKANLAAQMEKEHKFLEKQEKAKREAAKYEKEHRESLGRHVIEERNRAYIEAKTSAHTEVLDPSGKAARIDPSQITDIADFTFGLANSVRIPKDNMKKITELIRQELRVDKADYGEYQRLVSGLEKATTADALSDEEDGTKNPRKQRSTASPTNLEDEGPQNAFGDAELRQFATMGLANVGAVPGMDAAATSLNLAGNQALKQTLLLKTTEEEGVGGDVGSGSPQRRIQAMDTTKYPAANLSKFERDALDRAKDRHRSRIEEGVPQVAGGKFFQGPSFACTPAVVLFKDFEVGRSYRQIITLTNVSYTFNSFKLLDLPDAIIDFFTITFEKPGRMSAGMSCRIEIVFVPQVNKDIMDHLSFLTETGPVDIPLHCLIQRCAPRVLDTRLDFQEMIVGQKALLTVKMENTQALFSRFTIEEVRETQVVGPDGVPIFLEDEDSLILSPRPEVDAVAAEDVPNDTNGTGNSPRPPNYNAASTTSPPQIDVGAIGDNSDSGSNSAGLEAELWARVRRVRTAVLRAKQQAQARTFVCYAQSSVDPATSHETLLLDGLLPGYSTETLTVRCAPLKVGLFTRRFHIVFQDVDEGQGSVDGQGQLVTQVQEIEVVVQVKELPIYVEEDVVDLRCCFYDRIYRRQLQVHNRGQIAYRVSVSVPAAYKAYLDVSPTVFFVQALAYQAVNIRFTPNQTLLQGKSAYFTYPDPVFMAAALVAFPVEITVVNQDLPVHFVVRALTTLSTIDVSSQSLDFGKIYVGQQAQLPLTLQNLSLLPQKIAFVRLRKEVQVSPNEGFAVLLPRETRTFMVSFAPPSAIDYRLDVTLLTSSNDKIVLPLTARGVEAPLVLSHSVLHLRTTCPGHPVTESLTVTNVSSNTLSFDIQAPHVLTSWLTLSPQALTLSAGESARVEVQFLPPREVFQVGNNRDEGQQQQINHIEGDEGALQEDKSAAIITWFEQRLRDQRLRPEDILNWKQDHSWAVGSGTFGEVQWTLPPPPPRSTKIRDEDYQPAEEDADPESFEREQEHQEKESGMVPKADDLLPAEDWGIIGLWNIPIFFKKVKRPAALNNPAGDSSTVLSTTAAEHLDTTTNTMHLPSRPAPLFLTIETEVCRPQLEADVHDLDFGQIAVATRLTRSFRLHNRSLRNTIHVQSSNLSAVGPFTLLRPIRPIPPGESALVLVECLPRQPGLMVEVLSLEMTRRPAYRAITSRGLLDDGIGAEEDAAVVGGHRLLLPLRVQALLPSLHIEGLSSPYPTPVPLDTRLTTLPVKPTVAASSLLSDKPALILPDIHPRSGLLDLGHVLVGPTIPSDTTPIVTPLTRNLTLRNTSHFPITITIQRTSLAGRAVQTAQVGLSVRDQQALVPTTAAGLPILSVRPCTVQIAANSAEDIQIIYRPDRVSVTGGFDREDFELRVGATDEVLSLGVLGRAVARPYVVSVKDSQDDVLVLHNQWLQATSWTTAGAGLETSARLLGAHESLVALRKHAQEAQEALQLLPSSSPSSTSNSHSNPLLLLFADPYAPSAVPTSYTVVESGAASAPAAGAKKGGDKGGAAAAGAPIVESATTCRRQVKQLVIASAKIAGNTVPVDTKPATYEIQLDADAKASGLFTFSTEKGNVTPGKDEVVEVVCTQPRPRQLGGVAVGTWKTFTATVLVKGGWCAPGESDEMKAMVQLQAFVSI